MEANFQSPGFKKQLSPDKKARVHFQAHCYGSWGMDGLGWENVGLFSLPRPYHDTKIPSPPSQTPRAPKSIPHSLAAASLKQWGPGRNSYSSRALRECSSAEVKTWEIPSRLIATWQIIIMEGLRALGVVKWWSGYYSMHRFETLLRGRMLFCRHALGVREFFVTFFDRFFFRVWPTWNRKESPSLVPLRDPGAGREKKGDLPAFAWGAPPIRVPVHRFKKRWCTIFRMTSQASSNSRAPWCLHAAAGRS